MTSLDLTPHISLADPLTGPRVETWAWHVLDINGNDLGYDLDGVESATITQNVFNTIRGTGQMVWSGGPTAAPDWTSMRLQPWYTAVFPDGSSMSWPLGVFIPAAPKTSYSDTVQTAQIQLYDNLFTLDSNHMAQAYTVTAGTVVTDAVVAVLNDAGMTNVNITPSTLTVLTTMVWQPDVSHLQIVNDLLASINYFSLYCDAYGWFRGDPYSAPSYRGVARAFADGSDCIYTPNFDYDLDLFDAPNEIILHSTSDGTTPVLTSTAQNNNIDSPTSFPRRGFWISRTDANVSASSQAVLDALAQRRLDLASQVSAVVTINHAPVPDITLNDLVSFTNSAVGIQIDNAVVQSMQFSTAVGAMVQTQIQEVIS